MPLGHHHTIPNHAYDEGAQKLWSIYVHEAEQYDDVLTDTWKVDLDSTLIFAGLFSATVTAFIIEGYKLLKPDPDNATIGLLAQIVTLERAIAFQNTTGVPLIQPVHSEFKAPAWAIVVNVLWFLSLTAVLTAAITVTLVQQWVRNYFHRVHHYPQPLKRARMRLFLFAGIEKWKLDDIVEYIPILLHISLFLFFVGLCVFLANINIYVEAFVGSAFFCWLAVYCIATISPLFDFASPFETPLSRIISFLSSSMGHRGHGSLLSLSGLRELKAMKPVKPAEDDAQAISWTIQRLTDDGEREGLLASIPSFLMSKEGRKTWKKLIRIQHTDIIAMFIRGTAGLLDVVSPLSGGQVDTDELKRLTICLDALFSLLRATPHSWPPQIDISSLSQPLYRLAHASYKDKVALQTRAICSHALHKHLTVPFGMQSKTYSESLEHLQPTIMKLSLEADRGLHDLDKMRQKLEDDLEQSSRTDSEIDIIKVSASIQDYLNAIHLSSEVFARWLRSKDGIKDDAGAVQDVLGDWSGYLITVQKIINSRPIPLRGDNILSVSYQNTPNLKKGTWNIFALVIMAYMRNTRVYPTLSPLRGASSPDGISDSLIFWFNFCRDVDKWWIPEAFDQELLFLASALDILDPKKESTDIGGNIMTTHTYETMRLLKFSHSPPNLPPMGRPFSLWASIVYETAFGCETRGLSDLVCALRNTNICGEEIHTTTGPIIWETLRILKEGFNSNRSTGSLLFSFSVLREVLSWEREGSPFPFSEANIEYLVNEIFLGTLKKMECLIVLLDSMGKVDMIGNLNEVESNNEPGLPLYDLHDLFVVPAQTPTQPEKASLQVVLEPSQTLHWLEGRKYKRVDFEEDKKMICSQIMELRKQMKIVPTT